MEAETTIAATDIPNLDAATTVNGVVGTLVSAHAYFSQNPCLTSLFNGTPIH